MPLPIPFCRAPRSPSLICKRRVFSLVDTEEPFCVQALNYCLRRFAADPHSWNPMWIRRNPSVVLVLANEEKKLGDNIECTLFQDNRVTVGADAGHFVSISGWWTRWWTNWTSQASRRQKFWQDRFARDQGRNGRGEEGGLEPRDWPSVHDPICTSASGSASAA
jgi:hypothetical protein